MTDEAKALVEEKFKASGITITQKVHPAEDAGQDKYTGNQEAKTKNSTQRAPKTQQSVRKEAVTSKGKPQAKTSNSKQEVKTGRPARPATGPRQTATKRKAIPGRKPREPKRHASARASSASQKDVQRVLRSTNNVHTSSRGQMLTETILTTNNK